MQSRLRPLRPLLFLYDVNLKPILKFFKAENTRYTQRNRTVEIMTLEKGIDINSIKEDTKANYPETAFHHVGRLGSLILEYRIFLMPW